jgi:hypothetical protein
LLAQGIYTFIIGPSINPGVLAVSVRYAIKNWAKNRMPRRDKLARGKRTVRVVADQTNSERFPDV